MLPPFAGSIIPNALQLTGDTPNPEDEIIRVEQAHTGSIQDALNGQLDHVKAAGEQFSDIRQAIDTLPQDKLHAAITKTIVEGAGAGVNVAFAQLDGLGMAVNWGLANHAAAEWARTYSYSLVNAVNTTSRGVLQDALTEWVTSGAPIQDLYDWLAPWFGENRATMIASTEATRAYSNGAFTLYEQAGFAQRPPEKDRPPGHVRCRCWVGVEQRNGDWHYIWYTSNDELVCPICGPLANQIIGFAGKG